MFFPFQQDADDQDEADSYDFADCVALVTDETLESFRMEISVRGR